MDWVYFGHFGTRVSCDYIQLIGPNFAYFVIRDVSSLICEPLELGVFGSSQGLVRAGYSDFLGCVGFLLDLVYSQIASVEGSSTHL